MRRRARHTDRFGTPLRPLFADELRPVNAPAYRPVQCIHGRDESWLARCEADATHRAPDDHGSRYYPPSTRSWVTGAAWCPEHAPRYAVPIEES